MATTSLQRAAQYVSQAIQFVSAGEQAVAMQREARGSFPAKEEQIRQQHHRMAIRAAGMARQRLVQAIKELGGTEAADDASF